MSFASSDSASFITAQIMTVDGGDKRYLTAERISMMSERSIRIPGPDHPITIERNASRVVIRFDGQVLADSRKALTLREAEYPAVQYIPRDDVDMTQLVRSDHSTYCPYKGDCSYFSLPAAGGRGVDAVWTYETPFDAVAEITGHLAFYANRVEFSETD